MRRKMITRRVLASTPPRTQTLLQGLWASISCLITLQKTNFVQLKTVIHLLCYTKFYQKILLFLYYNSFFDSFPPPSDKIVFWFFPFSTWHYHPFCYWRKIFQNGHHYRVNLHLMAWLISWISIGWENYRKKTKWHHHTCFDSVFCIRTLTSG